MPEIENLGCFGRKTKSTKYALDALVLIARFRAGLAVLNLGYPENPALKLIWAMFINIILCWILKNCELDLAGLAGFWKTELGLAGLAGFWKIMIWL